MVINFSKVVEGREPYDGRGSGNIYIRKECVQVVALLLTGEGS